MYQFIRRLHLFSALVLLVFVAMYFATGYVMIHERWFPRGNPRTVTRTEPLRYTGNPATTEFVGYLEETFGVRGKLQSTRRQPDGSWKFEYVRPGMNHQLTVAADGSQVAITETRFDTVGLAHGLHRLHGYGGGWLYRVWAAVYDLTSAAMILFSLSGIYLWHQSTSARTLGWVCLGSSFLFTGAMIGYFLLSR